MTAILLVTGSRALVGSPHEADAHNVLASLVFSLPAESIVVTGDAPGPDQWATHYAGSGLLSLRQRVYRLDGGVYDERGEMPRRWDRGLEDKRSDKGWPLERNRVMVHECAAALAKGHASSVTVLALEASWSQTKGTAHTVGIARACGLALVHVVITSVRR